MLISSMSMGHSERWGWTKISNARHSERSNLLREPVLCDLTRAGKLPLAIRYAGGLCSDWKVRVINRAPLSKVR
jgi:hypothetical protein